MTTVIVKQSLALHWFANYMLSVLVCGAKLVYVLIVLWLFSSLFTSNNCAEVEMVLLPCLIQGVGLSCEVAVEDQWHKYDQEGILLRELRKLA